MYRGLLAKFRQHPALASELIGTGKAEIHEDSDDPFWGWRRGTGEDWLGRLLMTVREQIRTGELGRIRDKAVLRALSGTFSVGYQIAAGLRAVRSDLGPWLVHLIRSSAEEDPIPVLIAILKSGILRPTLQTSGVAAVCLSESPLTSWFARCFGVERELRIQHKVRLYSGCGIALPFDYAREIGVEPVLPVDHRRINDVPEDWRYRVQFYSATTQHDWTHEREWRARGEVALPTDLALVLVDSHANVRRLRESVEGNWQYSVLNPQGYIPVT